MLVERSLTHENLVAYSFFNFTNMLFATSTSQKIFTSDLYQSLNLNLLRSRSSPEMIFLSENRMSGVC